MKTAMQELLEWAEDFDKRPFKPTYRNMVEKIWELLPKEKQQIIDAWNKGNSFISQTEDKSGTGYFNKTYDQ